MNIFKRTRISDWLPPIIFRYLKSKTNERKEVYSIKFNKDHLIFSNGRMFAFRDSHEDRAVCRQVFVDQEYSTGEFVRDGDLNIFYEKCSQPLIIDAGANIGAASIWYAMNYPKAIIIAIEPEVRNFLILEKNVKQFSNIYPIKAAISSKPGVLYLVDPGQGAWGYRTSDLKNEQSIAVDVVTMEKILESHPNATPFIFKIDIEGAEVDLFSMAPKEFDRFPLLAMELHDWMLPRTASSKNFLTWHCQHNRDLVFRGENVFSISNSSGFLEYL
jgi:FkbM family methyltransferase